MPGWSVENVLSRAKNFQARAPKAKQGAAAGPPPDAHTLFVETLSGYVAQVRAHACRHARVCRSVSRNVSSCKCAAT